MDEMPVWFDMPSARTVNAKGAKTVLVHTTGHEKSRFTVVLACHGDLQTKDLAKRELSTWSPSYTVILRGGWTKLE